jgi:hypothetical protein
MTPAATSLPRLLLCVCFIFAKVDVAAQGGGALVGPGAITPAGHSGGNGGRRRGGWGVVGNWPAGFFIAGSSIRDMNGLYELIHRDNSLPHRAIMTWGNCGTGWIITNSDTTIGYGGPALGHKPMEWLLMDGDGVERFAHEGGKYLPGAGTEWKHMHSLGRDWGGNAEWNRGRLKPGDRVRTHITQEGDAGDVLWHSGEEGVVVDARSPKRQAETPNPVSWKRDKDGRLFDVPAFHLERLGGAAPFIGENGAPSVGPNDAALVDPRRQDSMEEAELPWQVVAIMNAKSMEGYVQRHREHEAEVETARKLHSARMQARRSRNEQSAMAGKDDDVGRGVRLLEVSNAASAAAAAAAAERTVATFGPDFSSQGREKDYFFRAAAEVLAKTPTAVEVGADGDDVTVDDDLQLKIDAALLAKSAALDAGQGSLDKKECLFDEVGTVAALLVLRGERSRSTSQPVAALAASAAALRIIEAIPALSATFSTPQSSFCNDDEGRKGGDRKGGPTFDLKSRALMLQSCALLDSGRPVMAIRYLENLIAHDRFFPYIEDWLLRAHSQARRRAFLPFVSARNAVNTDETAGAPALLGICSVGDLIEAAEDIDGFWQRGDLGVVIGLGPASAPIAARMGGVNPYDPLLQRLAERVRTSLRNRFATSQDLSAANATAAAVDAENSIIVGSRYSSVPWREQGNEGKLYDVQVKQDPSYNKV